MALKEEFRQQGDFLFKHRSYLPIIIVAIGLIVYVMTVNQMQLSLEQFNNNHIEILFLFVCLLGQFIRAVSVGYSAQNTSGRNTKVGQVADSLNSLGIYSIVRHPLYLGNFFMWLGIAMFTENLWFIIAFIFLYWLYYERIMYAEEEFLRSKYSKDYEKWADATPAIIPKFKQWEKLESKFDFWKVVKQEKSGILNLFLVIFIFKVVAGYVLFDNFTLADTYWTWLLLLAIIYYTTVKLIQKSRK